MNSSHSEEKIQKRFESIKNTPDSIQSIALWVQHHRSSLATITSVWIHVYKASDDTRRLALFYLTNEICQNTKLREKTDEFTNAFFPFILKAISISRVSDIVKDKIVKVVNLFEERRIFSSDQLAQMRKIQEEEIAADFDHSSITTEIENFRECTILALKGHKMLCHPDFSFTKYFKPKITDRIEGEKVIEEMESCLNRARAFTKLCDEHNERTGSVLGFVESAKKFYSIQLRDVAVVEDAYQKYFSGIQVVKRELLEMKRSGVYPGATPPRDAPSPSPMDDVDFGYHQKNPSALRDNVETMDMEMDEDDHDSHVATSSYIPTPMSSQSYAHVGNGVQAASQNQMYIPMPINPAGHSSSYTAPHPPHFNQAPPAALYTPQQPVPRFIPPVIPSTYRPSPPKPHFDQHRTQHHAAPSSQSRPPKPLPAGNANAIPLGAPRFGGPSNQAWRQRMNESSEAGYPNRKRGFHGDAGGRRHSNEHDRSIDDRRHSTGGRRF